MGDNERTYVGFGRDTTHCPPNDIPGKGSKRLRGIPPTPRAGHPSWEHPAAREQQGDYRDADYRSSTAGWVGGHRESEWRAHGTSRSVRQRNQGPQSTSSARPPPWKGREHVTQQHRNGHANSWGNPGYGRMAQDGCNQRFFHPSTGQRQQPPSPHSQRPEPPKHPNQYLYTMGGRPWTMYNPPLRPPPHPVKPGSGVAVAIDDSDESGVDKRPGDSVTVGPATAGPSSLSGSISVVTYNVLADSLVSFDYIPYCRGWNQAAWSARPGRILQKVLDFQPDVVCLQEVDEDQYKRVYRQRLGSIGYRGVFCKRTGDKKDGCATFVLEDTAKKNKGSGRNKHKKGQQQQQQQHSHDCRLRVVGEEHVNYKLEGHSLLDRDNVALLVVVDVIPSGEDLSLECSTESSEDEHGPSKDSDAEESSCSTGCADGTGESLTTEFDAASISAEDGAKASSLGGSGCASLVPRPADAARLVIANTHLLFNPKRGDIKTAQLMILTASVERLAEKSDANGVVVCGDFNMTPDSALYHYMVKGELDVNLLHRCYASGQCEVDHGGRYSQKSEVSNSGTVPYRLDCMKHQGSGCTLGSYRRPSTSARRGGRGGRGRGGSSNGRGAKHFKAVPAAVCAVCCRGTPHDAVASYIAAPSHTTPDKDDGSNPKNASVPNADSPATALPPGIRPGRGHRFAVMDPSPCRCTDEIDVSGGDPILAGGDGQGPKAASGSVEDKIGGVSGVGGGGEVGAGDGEGIVPPCLWPDGAQLGDSRDWGPVRHGLRLRSAYAQQGDAWGTGEPAFTTYHDMFKGTVDYMFYGPGPLPSSSRVGNGSISDDSRMDHGNEGQGPNALVARDDSQTSSGSLRCVGVAEPPLRCELGKFEGLPSPEEPSDHVLLAARFEISPPRS